MYTLQERERERESEESICDLKDNNEMQVRAIGKPARPAEASVRGSQSIEVVKKSCLVERQDDVNVNKTINAKPVVFFLRC